MRAERRVYDEVQMKVDEKEADVDGYDVEPLTLHLAESRRHYEQLNAALNLKNASLDVAYGAHPRQRLDIFPAHASSAPVMLFFHGGYWKGSSKESRRFPARTFNEAGVTWISVEYPLAPEVHIDTIVESAREAVAWTFRNIVRFGGDPSRIFVSGNSAGGQLVAMLTEKGWAPRHGLAANPIRGATAISPLADLRPLVGHPFNETFKLTAQSAAKLSPVLTEFETHIPLVVAVGGLEPREFIEQSRMLFENRRARGVTSSRFIVPGRDHASVLAELDDRRSELVEAMLKQIGSHGSSV